MPTIDKIIYSRRKTIALVVDSEGKLIIRAPESATKREINALVKKHTDWIIKKQAEVLESQEKFAPHQFVEGEEFYFLGETYRLKFTRSRKYLIRIREESLQVSRSARWYMEEAIEDWYKREARYVFNERVSYYAEKYDFSYRKLKLSSAKRRWGSCSSNGNINLTWRLVMMPLEIIDYVVVHELCHLREHNHSKAFWGQVEKILPNYKERRKWLKENGRQFLW